MSERASLRCASHHGTVSLVGGLIDEIGSRWIAQHNLPQPAIEKRIARNNSSSLHITILTAEECKSLKANVFGDVDAEELDLIDVGLSHITKSVGEIWIVVIHSEWVEKMRKQLNLAPKDLHITLAFNGQDNFEISKGFDTISHSSAFITLASYLELNLTKIQTSKGKSLIKLCLDLFFQEYAVQPVTPQIVSSLRPTGLWCVQHLKDCARELGYFLFESKLNLFGLRLLTFVEDSDRLVSFIEAKPVDCCVQMQQDSNGELKEYQFIQKFNRQVHLQSHRDLKKNIKLIGFDVHRPRGKSIAKVRVSIVYLPRNFSTLPLQDLETKFSASKDTSTLQHQQQHQPYLVSGSGIVNCSFHRTALSGNQDYHYSS